VLYEFGHSLGACGNFIAAGRWGKISLTGGGVIEVHESVQLLLLHRYVVELIEKCKLIKHGSNGAGVLVEAGSVALGLLSS